jgi:hypothetical protein
VDQVPIDVQDRRPVFLDVNDVIVPELVVQCARSGHARKNRAGKRPGVRGDYAIRTQPIRNATPREHVSGSRMNEETA